MLIGQAMLETASCTDGIITIIKLLTLDLFIVLIAKDQATTCRLACMSVVT